MPLQESEARKSAIRRILEAIAETLRPRRRASAGDTQPGPSVQGTGEIEPVLVRAARLRLAEEAASLEHLEVERRRLGDSNFGKSTENRIVWRELIELELQEIDEQLRRICGGRHL